MAGFIFAFDKKEIKKQNRLVVEFFLGTIKITKAGTFTGPLRKISIEHSISVSNISKLI